MTDDQVAEPTPRVSLLHRLLPPVSLLGDDGAPKPSRMTEREQLVAAGLGVASVAVSGGIASVVTSNQAAVLLAGLLASAVILVGARVGNRLVVLAGLFASTLVSGQIFFAVALPYYAAAIWIFLKYNRLVKEQAALRRKQRVEQRADSAASPRKGRPSGRSDAKKASSNAAPTRSKRYTPPKTRRKPPPPPTKPPRDRSIVD